MKCINKLYFFFCLVCLSFFSTSCSSILDESPDGNTTLDDVFKDNDKVAAYLNTCYANMPAMGVMYYYFSRGPVEWCDEAWDADDIAVPWASSSRYYKGDASASSHPAWDVEDVADYHNRHYWDNCWVAIHDCCYFLQRLPTATVTSNKDRLRWAAEAHLLRAYYYTMLLQWFGCDLPIVEAPFSLEQDYSSVKRSSFHDVVEFIIKDCDAALACDELPWRITTSGESGRVQKALAEAIKSRMILYAASPLYCGDNDYWEEAYNINKEALKELRANGYELYHKLNDPASYANSYLDNTAAFYNEYFVVTMPYTSTPNDHETIFQTRYDQQAGWVVDGVGAAYGYKSGTCPSQELVDCFETTDGQPILDLDKPYFDEETHLEPNYNKSNTIYNPNDPYKNRDPRFYADIYYNGAKRLCYWGFEEDPTCYENYPAGAGYRTRYIMTYKGEPHTGISATARNMTRTGYYIRKFLHPLSGNNIPCYNANHKEYRLSEIILNFAEAAANAGHLDEAIAAINEIRKRVGMPDLPKNISDHDLLNRIHNERRVELALEGFRYFDVRRWHKPDEDLSKTDKWVTSMSITRNPDGSFIYNRKPVSTMRECYTNKWLKCPIPLDEVNRIISITGDNWQNPGW